MSYMKVLKRSYKEHKANEYVKQQAAIFAGLQEPLFSIEEHHKHFWFGQVLRHNSLSKFILQGW